MPRPEFLGALRVRDVTVTFAEEGSDGDSAPPRSWLPVRTVFGDGVSGIAARESGSPSSWAPRVLPSPSLLTVVGL